MAIELSNEEKAGIINQHMRNLLVNRYNAELSVVEENSVSPVNQASVTALNNQITLINTKLTALQEELDSITE